MQFDYWASPTVFPETKRVLRRCDLPVCVVSNIDNEDLRAALEHNRLAFELVVTSEDCRSYKPRGELFQRALSLLELPPDRVLHVGDSLHSDVRGAKALGIRVLWINRTGRAIPKDHPAPDYVSTDLTGLLDLLYPPR